MMVSQRSDLLDSIMRARDSFLIQDAQSHSHPTRFRTKLPENRIMSYAHYTLGMVCCPTVCGGFHPVPY